MRDSPGGVHDARREPHDDEARRVRAVRCDGRIRRRVLRRPARQCSDERLLDVPESSRPADGGDRRDHDGVRCACSAGCSSACCRRRRRPVRSPGWCSSSPEAPRSASDATRTASRSSSRNGFERLRERFTGGRADEDDEPDVEEVPPLPLLQAEEINVTFGGHKALIDVSLDAEAGDVTGLIGPNGAGKTTMLQRAVRPAAAGPADAFTSTAPTSATCPRSSAAVSAWRARSSASKCSAPSRCSRTCSSPPRSAVAGREDEGSERARRTRANEIVDLVGLRKVADQRVDSIPTGLARLTELARGPRDDAAARSSSTSRRPDSTTTSRTRSASC